MISEQLMTSMRNTVVVTYFQHLPRGTWENHEGYQNNPLSVRGWKVEPLQCDVL
jgi:hypothetical protein